MTIGQEERIRELAHRIWEVEGRPDNQELRHWHIAERLAQASEMRDRRRAASEQETALAALPPVSPTTGNKGKKRGPGQK